MKKRMMTLAAIAVLAVTMTACGNPGDDGLYGDDYGVDTEMNGRFEVVSDDEPTEAPTATANPTVEPTTEPTVEPTATSTPVPTEAPVVEAKGWETVLRELHALTTYEEREAYIETLDKSKYEVAAVDNFDFIAIPNREEVVERDGMEEYITTKDTLLDPKLEGMYLGEILNYDGYDYYDDVDEYYLMTITNLATGETDPWGVKFHTELYDWETYEMVAGPVVTWTLETLVEKTSKLTDELNSYRNNKYAYIKTWDTKKYYAE